MNKKGNLRDHPYLIALLFSIALTIVIAVIIMGYLNQAYSSISTTYVTLVFAFALYIVMRPFDNMGKSTKKDSDDDE